MISIKNKKFFFLMLIAAISLLISGCLKQDPSAFLPNVCEIGKGFTCSDVSATQGKVTLSVINNAGRDVSDISITMSGCSTVSGKTSLTSGESTTYVATCDAKADSYFKSDVSLSYSQSSSPATGKVSVQVK